MFGKYLALFGLFVSLSANAATVVHNGYSLDTDTSIVTGGGLEWLQWDETDGQSVDTALTTYGGDGWRVATQAEVAGLLNDFSFPTIFDPLETGDQGASFDAPAFDDRWLNFAELFGCSYYCDSSAISTQVLYANTLGSYDRLLIIAQFNREGTFASHAERMLAEQRASDFSLAGIGVTLVRASVVPIPAAAWLFGSALAGLGWLRRR